MISTMQTSDLSDLSDLSVVFPCDRCQQVYESEHTLENHTCEKPKDWDGEQWRSMWLKPIPPAVRPIAIEALEKGDVGKLLIIIDSHERLAFVFFNQWVLKERGMFEEALLDALTSVSVNNHNVPLVDLKALFFHADRNRLRAAGDPLPGPGPFTLYRGVSGKGKARRVRGLSWTASRDIAWWFAKRYTRLCPDYFTDPAVFEVTVDAVEVLVYTQYSNEQEFIVDLPDSIKPVRVPADTCPVLANESITLPDFILGMDSPQEGA